MPLTRRSFLQNTGLVLAGTALRPHWGFADKNLNPNKCLLLFTMTGGVDQAQLFNNPGKGIEIRGSNGGKAELHTRVANLYRRYQSDLSIVNGVHMDARNSGAHDASEDVLHLRSSKADNLLGLISRQLHATIVGDISNSSYGGMQMEPKQCERFINVIQQTGGSNFGELFSTLNKINIDKTKVHFRGAGQGHIADSMAALEGGFVNAKTLASSFRTLKEPLTLANDVELRRVKASDVEFMVDVFFRHKLANVIEVYGYIDTDPYFDNHTSSPDAAVYDTLVAFMDHVFSYLKKAPGLNPKSNCLADDVAVVVTSEFSRTLVNEKGGNDHNVFGNTYLTFGGPFKGGLVIGETDSGRNGSDRIEGLRALDPQLDCAVGKPYFGKAIASNAPYKREDFLTAETMANTIAASLGIELKKKNYDGTPAPVVKELIRNA